MEWEWEIRKFWAFGEDLSKGLRHAPSRFLFFGFFFRVFCVIGESSGRLASIILFSSKFNGFAPRDFVSMVFLFCVCVSCPVLRFFALGVGFLMVSFACLLWVSD